MSISKWRSWPRGLLYLDQSEDMIHEERGTKNQRCWLVRCFVSVSVSDLLSVNQSGGRGYGAWGKEQRNASNKSGWEERDK